MNKDVKTMAFINMYGILECLPDLCRYSNEAKALIPKKPISISFEVVNGPSMTLYFKNGECRAEHNSGGKSRCDIRLPFSSCEKFNGMIDGTVTPFPSKGLTKIGFLAKNFTQLTKILEKYLRANEQDLSTPGFFEASTVIMFHLITRAISQIANNDKVGQFSASNISDGTVVLRIAGELKTGGIAQAALNIKDSRFSNSRDVDEHYTAIMEFANLKLARDIFDGKQNSLACVGNGLISMRGSLNMLDNVNRILDRVALYLA